MNTNLILQSLKSINKGTWFNLAYTSDLPLTAQAKRDGFVVYKRTTMTARWGINYKNISTVKERFEDKADVKHELSWGQWVPGHEGTLLEHKGTKYLRVYTSPNKGQTEFFVNGKPITKEGLMTLGIIQKSYWNRKGPAPECMSIKVENIENIWKNS